MFIMFYMKPLSGVCIFRDIMTIYSEPPPGMCIVPDKDDITKVNRNKQG